MPFLQDYLYYNSGNECPENYHIFGALTLVASIASRKIYLDWAYHRIYPNLYVLLVGEQGSRKGVAKDGVRDILVEHFPDIPLGASSTSQTRILERIATVEYTRTYKDDKDVVVEYHPITFLLDEFKHFLGFNMTGMIDMLTEAYSSKFMDTDFRNHSGKELIPNPYFVILACDVPTWVLERLKGEIISGGFARRVIMVYEKDLRARIAVPYLDDSMRAAMGRCLETLRKVELMKGRMVFEPSAQKFYEEWYKTLVSPAEPLMKGFYSSKHTQMLKIAMLLTLVDHQDFLLRRETIEIAIGLLDRIEPNMIELYRGAGRNDLALPTQVLLNHIEKKGGYVTEKDFLVTADRDLKPFETMMVLDHLRKTEQVVIEELLFNGIKRKMIMLKPFYLKFTAQLAQQPVPQPESSSAESTASPQQPSN